MKRMTLLAASMAVAFSASAQDLSGLDIEPGAMLYFSQPLDGRTQLQRTPSYGLRMDYVQTGLAGGSYSETARSVIDMRLQQGALQEVSLNGRSFAQRDPKTGRMYAAGEEITTTGWVALGVVAVAAGILIADDDDDAADNGQNQNQNQQGQD